MMSSKRNQKYYCCLDCSSVFSDMNGFIQHWTTTHEHEVLNKSETDDKDSTTDENKNPEAGEKYLERYVVVGEKECQVNLPPRLGEVHLIVRKSKIHGNGLFTQNYIRKGEIIIEYAGRVISDETAMNLERKYRKEGIDSYIMKLGPLEKKICIDGTLTGNCARYTNHSCNPNCSTDVVNFMGTQKVFIHALRDVMAGEELTFDYQLSSDELIPCKCRQGNCRRVLNWNVEHLKLKNVRMLLHSM